MNGHPYLKNANYTMWNKVEFITLKEFIYLSNGYTPGPKKEFFLWTLEPSNESFKEIFYGLERAGKELPYVAQDKNIEVRGQDIDSPEYPAFFLIEWAKQKGFQVNPYYNPVQSQRTCVNKKNTDNINSNKMNKIYTIAMAMAVAQYNYRPDEKRNSATGANTGSIKADVQKLASNLNRADLSFDIDEGTVKSFLDEAVEALLK